MQPHDLPELRADRDFPAISDPDHLCARLHFLAFSARFPACRLDHARSGLALCSLRRAPCAPLPCTAPGRPRGCSSMLRTSSAGFAKYASPHRAAPRSARPLPQHHSRSKEQRLSFTALHSSNSRLASSHSMRCWRSLFSSYRPTRRASRDRWPKSAPPSSS